MSIPEHSRAHWMGALARAKPARLAALMPDLPDYSVIRAPEIGTVMVQGRMGGTGAPFNLGEITVTRCVVALTRGATGHAHVQGRDKGHALRAAVADALMQAGDAGAAAIIETLTREEKAASQTQADRAAATRVEFFTMTRGEDA
ncbi:MAG: phosphonate C-P lyase system protein PhnG [Paracoccus sp. (in: a-proteobacteria)]|nr:phosphonate C-P lyase system protein PhnG [Paracoccus sp. (in: a-proteobacteria)]